MTNFFQRDYHRIYTGTNQTDGYDKIYLGYESTTSEIEFKKDSTTAFHIPFYTTLQNLSSGQIVGDGAIPGPIPAMADRIFKKQGNYGNVSPWGTTTDIPNGVWLCSWLYSLSGETPQWLDRFYNPGKISYDQALFGDPGYGTFSKNDPAFRDIPTTIKLEPGVLYEYFHHGENSGQEIVNTFAGSLSAHLRLNLQTWSSQGTDETIYENTYRIANFKDSWAPNLQEPGIVNRNILDFDNNDLLDVKVSYSDNYNLPNEFTLNFWVQNKDWASAPATQLVGNLNYGGYGIFYNNLKYYPFFVIPETFYGHLYCFNQEGQNYLDKSTQPFNNFGAPELSGSSSPRQISINSDNEIVVIDAGNNTALYKMNHLGDVLAVPRLSSGELFVISGTPNQFILDKNDNVWLLTTEKYYYFDRNLTFAGVSSLQYVENANNTITGVQYSYNNATNITPGIYSTPLTSVTTTGFGASALFEIEVNGLSAVSNISIIDGGEGFALNEVLSIDGSIFTASGTVGLSLTSTNIGFGGQLVYDLSGNILREPPCIDVKYDVSGKKWLIKNDNNLYTDNIQLSNYINCTNISIDPDNNVWVFYNNNIITKVDTNTLSAIATFEIGLPQQDTNNISFIFTYDRTKNTQKWYGLIYKNIEQTLYKVTLDGEIEQTTYIPDNTNIELSPPDKEDKRLMQFNSKGDFTGYEWKRIFNRVLYNNNPQLQFKITTQKPLRGTPLKTFTVSVPVQYLADSTWHLITGILKNRTLSIYVDTRLRDQIVLPGNYSVSYLRRNDLYIGTPTGKFTNLNTELNSKALIFNGYIDNIKIYDYAIDSRFLNIFVRSYFRGENLIWSIPTSAIQYIEGVERFFKHKAPGSKTGFFKIKLSGFEITDTNTRMIVEESVKAAIREVKPAYSELLSIEWV